MRNSLVFIVCLMAVGAMAETAPKQSAVGTSVDDGSSRKVIVPSVPQNAVSVPAAPMPSVPSETEKGGWKSHGELPYTYAMGKVRVRSYFENAGYALEQEIPLGKRGERCLMLWKRKEQQVIVMLWKIGTDRTGYQQGEVKNRDRKNL